MLIGYARVSTQDQTLRLQHDALTDGGCEKLCGTSTILPAREKLLAFARKGDVVVGWKFDRLGRSLRSARSGPGREAAKRTLDGEDRFGILQREGKGGHPHQSLQRPSGGAVGSLPAGINEDESDPPQKSGGACDTG